MGAVLKQCAREGRIGMVFMLLVSVAMHRIAGAFKPPANDSNAIPNPQEV